MKLQLAQDQAGAISTRLPAERNRFIGREHELAVLARLLATGVRAINVVGPRGIGKSRLVRHFSWWVAPQCAGGVWWFDLGAARGFGGLALDLRSGRAGADVLRQWAGAMLGRGECLVVLDNVDPVRALVRAVLAFWLRRVPMARFVLCSREGLGLAGAQVVNLGPLPGADAAALFDERARAAHSTYQPGAGDRAALALLMQRLGGSPLAIEAAAAKVRVLGPQAQLDRWRQPAAPQGGRLVALS